MEAIIEAKVNAGEFKTHPDAPECPDATLFYCLIDLDRIEEDEREDKIKISYTGEMDGDAEAKE